MACTGKMTIDAEDKPLPLASRFPKAAIASSAIEDAVSKPGGLRVRLAFW